MHAPPNAIRFVDVHLNYAADAQTVQALAGVSFDVAAGEFVTVVGPSGCGKSTLLNLACGILQPSQGQISVNGQAVDRLIQHGLGYVFQSDALLPWKSVFENVALALRLQRCAPDEITRRVERWIKHVGLEGFSQHLPSQLSGGMRKRVAIAQALVHEPSLVFMDEPFSSLDVQTRMILENEVLRLWEDLRVTVLFITHDLEEAIALSDRVVVLSARPARVKSITRIDLPRPRDVLSLRADPDFHALFVRLWNDLREEVITSAVESGAYPRVDRQ